MTDQNWWSLLNRNWGKILGALLGLIFALLVVNHGFWISIFIFICIGIGLLLGWRLDISKDFGRYFRRLFSSKDDY